MVIQRQCSHCKRFSAMQQDYCPHCGRKQKHDRKFEWLVILSFIILIGTLFRVLLFGGG